MTRAEEVARLAEIEASPHASAKLKKVYREAKKRQWALEDAGVIDMMDWKTKRMVAKVNREVGEQ